MSSQPPAAEPEGGRSFGRQAGWNYVVFALSKSTTLIMTVVLARLLGPADFGLFALALLVMTMFDFVRDFGIGVALVQRPEQWSKVAPTGATLTLVSGVLIGGLAAALAPVAAFLLGDPRLTPIVQVLAIALVISALSVLPMAALRRRLDFRGRLLPEVAGAVLKAAVAIGLAAGGVGVWSLVWAQLAGSLVTTVGYWVLGRTSLRLGMDRRLAVALLKFGLPVTAVAFLTFAVFNTPTAAIGRLLGAEELGYYTLAYRLPDLVVINLCAVVGDVLFSALSRLQDDKPALAARYLQTVRTVVALSAPIGFGLAAVSTEVVAVFYGAQFAPAAGIAAALSVFTVIYSINFHAGDVYKALGRPGLLTSLGTLKLVVLVPVVVWAAHHSALWVAVAMAAVEGLLTVVRLSVVRRILGVTIRQHVAALWGPVLAAALMAGAVYGLLQLVPDWPAAVRLIAGFAIGVILYATALWVLAPSLPAAARTMIRNRRAPQPETV
ncbi:oligosaccharide flippase family protein [Pseudonocardia lacus]|uniref:oligosaccharide flippase family protein n=1 Tax=Pseudonocardia lacus TaxID=2835865 RepID=UPI001BDD80EB|nr:oligosaccharide flippase family protein [Pseudonocardia lacus]